MSFSGFGKSSGPSIPPTTQKTFGSASAFPWIPPISNPNLPIVSAIIQKVDQEPLHQLIPSPTKTFDSSFNKLARQRISPPHSDLSHNMLDHTNSKFVAQHDATSITGKPAYLVTPKRARSPIEYDDNPLHSLSALPDSEREKQAKVKRLARFHTELTQPLQNLQDLTRGKPIGNKRNQISLFQQKDGEHAENTTFGGSLLDPGGSESTKAVIGLCPDMCPELERDERERKGDLDKHERLNGDRNQTSKFIAVKKYNRLAEREAELIRPMPVLLKTVDYLLSLLDQPYDGNFLYLYNFLWDRMRAVRMDLRMQHIFNEDAILLLEQMIRLHVIAMHELCEFEKGEGFTEGFDAHLNIEQMNKTSVELFQLYDDHRKQGKSFASEKEFRGYYALLKLDKHPGYKVEPAELSLDLAKMAPEIRSSPEILFARDVARACRIGNYVSFFRLARKATYLQACLMHAHFSKLRKQALDSLHSGLQNNQGVPIAHVEKWLAMEGEDVVGLLEYHGFSIRKYEEAYMVKEGPFLSSDVDFPTRCAQLVQHKRSKYIVSDVRSTLTLERHSSEKECPNNSVDIFDHRNFVKTGIQLAAAYDEIMSDNIIRSAPTVIAVPSGLLEEKLPFIPNTESKVKFAEMPVVMEAFVPPVGRIGDYAQQDGSQQIVFHDNKDLFNEATLLVLENNKKQPTVHESLSSSSHMMYENLTSKEFENQKFESDSLPPLLVQQEIARKEILKRIVRKWKRHAASRRRNREQEIYLAGTALSSLSLGPPIVQIESQTWSSENFDIDAITRARFGKYDHSWSRLNISDLVFPIMAEKNPSARCICWKLVVLVQPVASDNQIYLSAIDWLFFKLLGSSTFHDADLAACSPGLSIWKKWSDPCKSSPLICCLSIVRVKVIDDMHQIERDVLYGADCLVYLVSETIPWGVQQARLQNVLASIPPASNFPLLILSALSPCSAVSPSSEAAEGSLEIIKKLALNEEKRNMRTHPSTVIFLAKNSSLNGSHGFFDDDQLRMGIQWLANNVPSAPLLRPIRTRQLVLNHLQDYINAASKQKEFDVAPNDCIAVFNKALDEAANEIIASMDPAAHWPAPEIYLVHAASEEGILAGQCFPTAGWNSPTRINAIIQAIESCKLPSFPCTSRLELEPLAGERIRQQALVLEELLVHFLNGLNGLLKADAAALESGYMLQHCVGLRQCELGYCLAPRWMFIFQRIYSWQLNRLMAPGITDAYVKDGGAMNDLCLSIHSLFADVTLDELIELSCSNNPFERRPVLGAIARDSKGGDGKVARTDVLDDEDLRCSSPSFMLHINADRQTEATPIASSCERLTMLLEQCNRLQDKIDQKMAIYF